ncbi:hypothetical protein KKA87_17290 [bacterium]|nr:hypothetical protein [bacterium]MBU1872099.1 hypothetical protein [bacterium]
MSTIALFTSTDPEGRIVSLYDENYIHIYEEHSQQNISRKEIASTIEYPDIIKESEKVKNSLIYTKEDTSRTGLDLNVTTKFDTTLTKGKVTSAYRTDKPLKGKIVWKRT